MNSGLVAPTTRTERRESRSLFSGYGSLTAQQLTSSPRPHPPHLSPRQIIVRVHVATCTRTIKNQSASLPHPHSPQSTGPTLFPLCSCKCSTSKPHDQRHPQRHIQIYSEHSPANNTCYFRSQHDFFGAEISAHFLGSVMSICARDRSWDPMVSIGSMMLRKVHLGIPTP